MCEIEGWNQDIVLKFFSNIDKVSPYLYNKKKQKHYLKYGLCKVQTFWEDLNFWKNPEKY